MSTVFKPLQLFSYNFVTTYTEPNSHTKEHIRMLQRPS